MKFSAFLESFQHGSEARFDKFKPGGHGAIYFSDVKDFPKDRIQAHAYARPYLYTVEIEGGKRFDPRNDSEAMAILKKAFDKQDVWDKENKLRWGRLDYQDAWLVIPLAVKAGYNRFRVYECSVNNWSEAVTDPSLITIINVEEMQ